MPTSQSTQSIIASALSLPAEQRLTVMDAIHVSLADPSVDHGPEENAELAQAAWKQEIARRIEEIDSGRVKTIPSDEAERMIRGDVKPTF